VKPYAWAKTASGNAAKGKIIPPGSTDISPNAAIVVQGRYVTVVVPNGGGNILLCAPAGKELFTETKIRIFDGNGRACTALKSVKLLSNDGDTVELVVRSAADSGRAAKTLWRVHGTSPCVGLLPQENAAGIAIDAQMEYVIVPDRLANDVVCVPGATAKKSLLLPADGLVMGLMRGGGSILGITRASSGQEAVVSEEKDFFSSVRVDFAGKPVHLSLTAGQGLWHRLDSKSGRASADKIKWQWASPHSAIWRMAVLGKDGTACRLFSDKDILYTWWDKKEVQYQRIYAGAQTPAYDGKYISVNKAEAGGADVPNLLVYLYDRTADTPPEVFTPVDVLRSELGLKGYRDFLNLSGIVNCRTAVRRTTWPDVHFSLSELAFVGRGKRQETQYIHHLCADIESFMAAGAERLEEYRAFSGGVRAIPLPAAQEAEIVRKLRKALRQLDEVDNKAAQIKSLKSIKAGCDGLRKLLEPGNKELDSMSRKVWEKKVSAITSDVDACRAVLADYRYVAKAVCDLAARAQLQQGRLSDSCVKMRKAAHQVLRNRHILEGDRRGEKLRYIRP